MKKVVVFLALCFASVAFAQAGFTPVEYEFMSTPDENGAGALSAPCQHDSNDFYDVAANGYGQWAVNKNWEWFLLQHKATTTISAGSIPRDTNIHSNCLAFVQVATNLRGSTRFVWRSERDSSTPSGNFQWYSVAGFNDQDFATANLAEKQIDITFPIGTNPVILPPFVYPDVPIGVVQDPIGEVWGYHDIFRICMDVKYLYIVYATQDTEIYLTVQDLHGNVPFGYPKLIGKGRRPTVSCDVRNNPSAPTCDIAYIDSVASNGQVWYTFFNNGAIAKQLTMPQFFTWEGPDSLETWEAYDVPFHAKMLTGSVYDGAKTSKGIYIIFHDGEPNLTLQTDTTGHLIFHEITQDTVPDANAKYVDGWRMHSPTIATAWDVIDRPIKAVANPYDGQGGMLYDEFHAIYRRRETIGGNMHNPPYRIPVYIAREDQDVTCVSQFDANGGAPGGWAFLRDGYHNWTISVNQMGLHVRWTSVNPLGHTYNRSMRSFDEPIEEHTLAVNNVELRDGSDHFGSEGATLLPKRIVGTDTLPGRIMTLFSTGTSASLAGTFDFDFGNPDITLEIGEQQTSSSATQGARLIIMPNTKFSFTASNQELNVNYASSFEYRAGNLGIADEASIFDNVSGGGRSLNFRGDSMIYQVNTGLAPTFINPATLTVATGTSGAFTYFIIPSFIDFTTNNTLIDVAFLRVDSVNVRSAKVSAKKSANLKRTHILSHVSRKVNADTSFFGAKSFIADSLFVSNSDDTVTTTLFSRPDSNNFKVTNSSFVGARLRVANPVGDYAIIQDNYFDNIPQSAIHLTRSGAGTLDYDSVFITNNIFKKSAGLSNTRYIFVDGFSKTYDGWFGNVPSLMVNDNVFTHATTNAVEAAIHFNNSTGAIIDHSITGLGFQNGIVIANNTNNFGSTAFICRNVIQNCSVSGVSTSRWEGYVKLSQVSECLTAHTSGVNDIGGIAFAKYFNCDGAAIRSTVTSSSLDLRGVSNDVENYAFFDTLQNCNRLHDDTLGLIVLPASGTIRLGEIDSGLFSAHNNFLPADDDDNFIFAEGSASIGSIDSNFWDGYVPTSPDARFPNVTFTRNDLVLPDTTHCPFSVFCGSGTIGFGSKHKHKPQSMLGNNCESLYNQGIGYRQLSKDQEAFQTFSEFIESCHAEYQSWRAFIELTSANRDRKPDTVGKNLEFREWLKKVLYYNTADPYYYCQDVSAIYSTYLGFDRADGVDVNSARAVARYLLDSTDCPEMEGLKEQIENQKLWYFEYWSDTVKDPVATPFDTTTPKIDDLGLAIIRKSLGSILPSEQLIESVLNLNVSPNPFTNEIAVSYVLADNTILHLEILDILGRELYHSERQIQSAGSHEERIRTDSWNEGTYFVRLTTSRGESKTVKIVLQR